MPILIDSNIILDIFTEDPQWFAWSSQKLAEYAETAKLCINPVIYAEISIRFQRIEDLEDVLPRDYFRREPLPYEAAFLAGKCFLQYRKRGGIKQSLLPDFLIGAHAAVMGWPLMTRDVRRYAAYFPKLKLVTQFSD
jgi:predicted nucleic acid-binding protein